MVKLTRRIQDLLPPGAKRGVQALKFYAGERSALKTARPVALPEGFARIYHHHIRRSAGTSLNSAFFATGGPDFAATEPLLATQAWMVHGGRVYVAHNKFLIERGAYFFARSHSPAHELRLPPGTFSVTILRDPVERVISHYNVLMEWEKNNVDHPSRATEGQWLGRSFADFLDRMPREHLSRQLFTFSSRFDVDEARVAIAKVDCVLIRGRFADGLAALGARLGLDLALYHDKTSVPAANIAENDRDRLREMLAAEYALLEAVRGAANVHPGASAAAPTAPLAT